MDRQYILFAIPISAFVSRNGITAIDLDTAGCPRFAPVLGANLVSVSIRWERGASAPRTVRMNKTAIQRWRAGQVLSLRSVLASDDPVHHAGGGRERHRSLKNESQPLVLRKEEAESSQGT